MTQPREHRFETKLIHAGEPADRIRGAVAMPVFQSSTFLTPPGAGYHDLNYIRLNNTPNHEALHAKLAAIEGGEAGLVAASGMAAITTTLLTLLRTGDHLLAQNCLYGGTHDFVTQDFERMGLTYGFIDAAAPDTWKAALRPETKAIYVETITNPLVQVGELLAIARFAREHGLISIIDNTFSSPINFRPLEHGFDLVLHSGTKYLNGHTDIVAGAVVGRRELVERIRHKLNHLGGSLDPHACFLLHRGLKTLALRVRCQNDNALRIARFLEGHDRVARVHYPGLPSHAGHTRASAWFAGFGGMLSFVVDGDGPTTQRFIDATTIPLDAPSLGGVETLITRPATTSHEAMNPAEREKIGITDSLVRLSVGIEAAEDLMDDLDRALRAV